MSDSVTPWTIAHQAPPSMEFSRPEYWSGLLFPSPVDLPDPGVKPGPAALQAASLPSEPQGKPLMNNWRKPEECCFRIHEYSMKIRFQCP